MTQILTTQPVKQYPCRLLQHAACSMVISTLPVLSPIFKDHAGKQKVAENPGLTWPGSIVSAEPILRLAKRLETPCANSSP